MVKVKPFKEFTVNSREGYNVTVSLSENLDFVAISIDVENTAAVRRYMRYQDKDDGFDDLAAGGEFEAAHAVAEQHRWGEGAHVDAVGKVFERANRMAKFIESKLGNKYEAEIDSPDEAKEQFFQHGYEFPIALYVTIGRPGNKELYAIKDKKKLLPAGLEEDMKRLVLELFRHKGLHPVVSPGDALAVRLALEQHRGKSLTFGDIDGFCNQLDRGRPFSPER